MKAQIFTLDFMVAVTIMLILVGSISVLIFQFEAIDNQNRLNREIQIKSQNAVDTLTQTSGSPNNWETLT